MRSFWTLRISSMMRSKMRFTPSAVKRAAVVRRDVVEDLALALRLVDRRASRLFLTRPISSTIDGAFVEQFDQPAVDFVDPLAASRQRACGVLSGAVEADIGIKISWLRTQWPRQVAHERFELRRSPVRSGARWRCRPPPLRHDPASAATCSGVEMPKPIASGRPVWARMRSMSGSAESAMVCCSPVMPVRETR